MPLLAGFCCVRLHWLMPKECESCGIKIIICFSMQNKSPRKNKKNGMHATVTQRMTICFQRLFFRRSSGREQLVSIMLTKLKGVVNLAD